MKPVLFATLSILCATLTTTPTSSAQPSSSTHNRWTFQHDHILGTSLDLQIHAASPSDAQHAEQSILHEISRLNQILSTWNPQSEASEWMQSSTRDSQMSPELFEVLSLFDHWRIESQGALNPAAQSIIQLWQKAAQQQRIPTSAEVAKAVQEANQPPWSLNPSQRTATRTGTTPLVFGSFVKSYIMQRALNAALSNNTYPSNLSSILLNLGGDIITHGPLSHTISIANPRDDAENAPALTQIKLRNAAIATSGGYRRHLQIQGKSYSHIIDPRTGQPAGHILSATVVAPDATTAGALATSSCILSPEETLRLISQHPGAECLLITADGRRIASPYWHTLEIPTSSLVASALPQNIPSSSTPPASGTTSTTWDPSMELVVTLEIAPSSDPRYRRPFVAVWIEDNDKYPVRTIALWYKGERWLPDLRAWSHSEQLRALSEGTDITATVSSATRSPGKYTIKWDGKDNGGKPVKAGKYTVHIEAAREHGTYQVAKQEVDFSGQPTHFDLKGGTELSKISLDYHRK